MSYLDGISFRVGRIASIEELFGTTPADKVERDFFLARGLRNFCIQDRPLGTMCTEVVRESLEKCSLSPDDVGAVVVDSEQWHCTSEDRIQLLESLQGAGFEQVPVLGLELQTCSGVLTGIDIADRLVRAGHEQRPTLVLVCGRAAPGSKRADVRRATVWSDGVAACVVSARPGRFSIVASAAHTNLSMVRSGVAGEKAAVSVVRSHANICKVSRKLYEVAGVKGSDIDALLCTNGNLMYATFAGRATGVEQARIFTENIPIYGHVFSCDHLINLATYEKFRSFEKGGRYLLVGWSPYVFAGLLLSYDDVVSCGARWSQPTEQYA